MLFVTLCTADRIKLYKRALVAAGMQWTTVARRLALVRRHLDRTTELYFVRKGEDAEMSARGIQFRVPQRQST